jgi:hypothetical protein
LPHVRKFLTKVELNSRHNEIYKIARRDREEVAMIDFLLDALLLPATWVGMVVGILGGCLAYAFLPESADRASIGGWLVALGFIGGLAWSVISDKKK